MKAYFISGLGADSRVFNEIVLPSGYEIVHLHWISPLKNESLHNYALRMSEKIDTHQPFILVGLSMGGMIATEIARKYNAAATILISSVPCKSHLPARFRIAYFFRLHKMLPAAVIKSATLIKRLFTVETAAHKKIMCEVINDSDPKFIRWAMNAILKWKNEETPDSLWHIHGTMDEVLPIKYTKPTHAIDKGRHMMVLSRSGELNNILTEILQHIYKPTGI